MLSRSREDVSGGYCFSLGTNLSLGDLILILNFFSCVYEKKREKGLIYASNHVPCLVIDHHQLQETVFKIHLGNKMQIRQDKKSFIIF